MLCKLVFVLFLKTKHHIRNHLLVNKIIFLLKRKQRKATYPPITSSKSTRLEPSYYMCFRAPTGSRLISIPQTLITVSHFTIHDHCDTERTDAFHLISLRYFYKEPREGTNVRQHTIISHRSPFVFICKFEVDR